MKQSILKIKTFLMKATEEFSLFKKSGKIIKYKHNFLDFLFE
jgi:hypothetical protein